VERDVGAVEGDSVPLENVGFCIFNLRFGKFFSLACIAEFGESTNQPEIAVGRCCRRKGAKLAGDQQCAAHQRAHWQECQQG
jgi:hypothetical protein